MLSDLRESGSIEQDADIVMFIHREELYKPDTDKKNIADIIIAKHRNGPVGQIPVRFFPSQTRFADLEMNIGIWRQPRSHFRRRGGVSPKLLRLLRAVLLNERAIVLHHLASRLGALGVDRPFRFGERRPVNGKCCISRLVGSDGRFGSVVPLPRLCAWPQEPSKVKPNNTMLFMVPLQLGTCLIPSSFVSQEQCEQGEF